MIYFDHNASSPPTSEHLQKLFDILNRERPANPSSPHVLGRTASVLMSQARKHMANALNVDVGEVIFTSGGTESNNLGTYAVAQKKLKALPASKQISIITTAFEHPSVLRPLEQLKQTFKDQLELIILQPNSDGYISVQNIIKNIKINTILISIMAANNEIGTIQPVKEFGDFLNFKRWGLADPGHGRPRPYGKVTSDDTLQDELEKWDQFLDPDISAKILQEIHFHVDAVQIFGKMRTHTWMSQGFDSIALSGHKLGALQGIGSLILKRGRTFLPLNVGGAQEKNRRAGTENIPGIISFGLICEEMVKEDYWHKIDQMEKLTHLLFDGLSKNPAVILNSHKTHALPNTVHFSVLNANAEDLIVNLDMQGICVSSGSACSSGVNLPSHVVLALHKDKTLAANSVRVSLGIENTFEQIQKFLSSIL